ncbi:spore coat protein [Niallia sp. Krafla_26]|uniref:spore coat protein n=1 Tax=Niallia sp. Krafla_26 TaxID=3064703 RepID=UPI003D1757E7
MEDYLDPRNAEGMPNLADSAIAMEFLLSVKTGIRNYGFALTETANPELRKILFKQMNKAIDLHEELSNFMIKKDWLNPSDFGRQYEVDLKSAQTAVQIAKMNLYPQDTDRLGMFATPNK